MPAALKSPLHPSALTINDLNPGRTIVYFNREYGIQGTYTVLERPAVLSTVAVGHERMHVTIVPPGAYALMGKRLMVKLRDVATGISSYWYLIDLGVVEAARRFNPFNFVVDYRKRHLLPTGIRADHG